jgi:hypothetical protein
MSVFYQPFGLPVFIPTASCGVFNGIFHKENGSMDNWANESEPDKRIFRPRAWASDPLDIRLPCSWGLYWRYGLVSEWFYVFS